MADNDTDDLDLDGQDTGDDDADDDGADDADGDDGDSDPKADPKVDKRISDLQSKADKAEARANKLEAQLQKALGGSDKGGEQESKDPERAALMQELREASLDAVWGEFPELKTYGIDRALVTGATRAEMRESATGLVALINSVATKAKNQTLREHGIKAEPAGATRQPPKDYRSMKPEDFEKEIARAKGGGDSLW